MLTLPITGRSIGTYRMGYLLCVTRDTFYAWITLQLIETTQKGRGYHLCVDNLPKLTGLSTTSFFIVVKNPLLGTRKSPLLRTQKTPFLGTWKIGGQACRPYKSYRISRFPIVHFAHFWLPSTCRKITLPARAYWSKNSLLYVL
jgi:hypothetical protein